MELPCPQFSLTFADSHIIFRFLTWNIHMSLVSHFLPRGPASSNDRMGLGTAVWQCTSQLIPPIHRAIRPTGRRGTRLKISDVRLDFLGMTIIDNK